MNGCKPSIGGIKMVVLLAIAIIFDGFKIILMLFNALPIIGTVIDFVTSVIISAIEDLSELILLWASGAYKGKGGMANLLMMLGISATGFVPLVDDFPLTTINVAMTILRVKAADKVRCAAENAARVVMQNQQLQEQEALDLAAQRAAMRADEMRQQALQYSVQAANDNGQTANDNAGQRKYRQAA